MKTPMHVASCGMASGSNILQAALEDKLGAVRHFLEIDPTSVKKADKKGGKLRVVKGSAAPVTPVFELLIKVHRRHPCFEH